MKIRQLYKRTKTVLIGTVFFGFGWLMLSAEPNIFDSQPDLGLQTASANTQYGILGRQAPEMDLNTWIDGNGKPMDPLRLKDYRGKVVYLYFFQDW